MLLVFRAPTVSVGVALAPLAIAEVSTNLRVLTLAVLTDTCIAGPVLHGALTVGLVGNSPFQRSSIVELESLWYYRS